MSLTKEQKEILIGIILGDGYLQKTGKKNARLRLEHSEKQKEYLFWKYQKLKNLMQSEPKRLTRFNPIFKKKYFYYRCQSHSSPVFGKFHRWFYENQKKKIPDNIGRLLRSPLTLAVWYMDDGYYYTRDKVAYLYLPPYSLEDLQKLLESLEGDFQLKPKIYYKKNKLLPCFYFPPAETIKLFKIIKKFIHPSLKYKVAQDPVTTEGAHA